MPGQDSVDIFKQILAHHVNLARPSFLGRRAVEPDRAGSAGPLQPFFRSDGRGNRTRPEKVMAASMAGAQSGNRSALAGNLLGESGKSVVLREDADHRRTLAIARNESRGHSRNAASNIKARRLQLGLQKLGTSFLLIPDFGEVPDLFRDVGVVRTTAFYRLRDGILALRATGDRCSQPAQGQHPQESCSDLHPYLQFFESSRGAASPDRSPSRQPHPIPSFQLGNF